MLGEENALPKVYRFLALNIGIHQDRSISSPPKPSLWTGSVSKKHPRAS
jgi:hypothetical protein